MQRRKTRTRRPELGARTGLRAVSSLQAVGPCKIPPSSGAATISAIMPRRMKKKIPTTPPRDSGTATVAGSFTIVSTGRTNTRSVFVATLSCIWQDRYYWPIVVTGLLLPFVLGVWHGGWQGGISGFLLGGLFRMFMVLNSTFTINSLCHMVGAQPYSTKDSSRDSWLVSFVSFGEGYHNFHHAFARDFRNGPKWYNFDPSKWIIYTLSLIGLASNLRRNDPTVG